MAFRIRRRVRTPHHCPASGEAVCPHMTGAPVCLTEKMSSLDPLSQPPVSQSSKLSVGRTYRTQTEGEIDDPQHGFPVNQKDGGLFTCCSPRLECLFPEFHVAPSQVPRETSSDLHSYTGNSCTFYLLSYLMFP